MDLNEFIRNFTEQFDDTDSSEITAGTDFQNLDEWSSMTSLGVIAVIKIKYSKDITSAQIRSCGTVEDLFNLVKEL